LADDVLRQAVQGIAELVTQPGLINVDFAHVRNMMKRGGGAFMAIGHGQGEEKTFHAIQQALKHPLLESVSLEDASGVIANFSGGDDLSLYEVGEAIGHIRTMTGDDVDVVMGVTHDERLQDRAQVILVVTGLGTKAHSKPAVAEPTKSTSAIDSDISTQAIPEVIEESREAMPVDILNDLDVPAFMRKRARVNAKVGINH
jgi:cell division protein FtsZ